MSVLVDHQIRYMGTDVINPFDPEAVQPSSYDLKLSCVFRVFNTHDLTAVDLGEPASYKDITRVCIVDEGKGFVLHPGEFVLGGTVETLSIPDDLVARIEGKSSLGRLGLIVHATAGYVDPGFKGALTLEMTNLLRVPIVLRPSRFIAQLSFMRLDMTPSKTYNGRYQGDIAVAPSRYGDAWQPKPAIRADICVCGNGEAEGDRGAVLRCPVHGAKP